MVTGRLAVMAPQRATLKRLMGWSYRTLEEEVKTNAGWRWVSGLYGEAMPRFQTVQTREAMLTPTTLALINRQAVNSAVELELTCGEWLRKVAQPLERAARLRGAMDSSATDSDIHYPTDSSLLDDSARVLSRTFKRARKVVRPESLEEKAWFRDGPSKGHFRHRQAHRLAWKIAKQARKTEKNSPKAYTDLLKIVGLLVEQAKQVQERLGKLESYAAQKLSAVLEHYVPLVQQVVWQTQQRIIHNIKVAQPLERAARLRGAKVEASDKLLSLFEPHTDIIVRGKAKPNDVEFGHKVWFAEVEGGYISEYRILGGNPREGGPSRPCGPFEGLGHTSFVTPTQVALRGAIRHHRQIFGHAPTVCAGDRGLHSTANEHQAHDLGVKRVSLPKPGYKSAERKAYEHQPWFRAAQRFRNGIEGRISQLRRARRLDRDTPSRGCCLNVGLSGFQRWVGWGVIANNISLLANHLAKTASLAF